MVELYHYGVKGMKWGVHKSVYKSMNRQQRKDQRRKYYDSPEGKLERAAIAGFIIGGPPGSAVAVAIQKRRMSDISKTAIDSGEKRVNDTVNKNASMASIKTESKRVADIKSRVTGRKEDGKPSFLMSKEELEDFAAQYKRRQNELVKQYKSATNPASKQRIGDQIDRLELDYLDVVEQDFWYADD